MSNTISGIGVYDAGDDHKPDSAKRATAVKAALELILATVSSGKQNVDLSTELQRLNSYADWIQEALETKPRT